MCAQTGLIDRSAAHRHTNTDTHTWNENSISAIHSGHLVEIIIFVVVIILIIMKRPVIAFVISLVFITADNACVFSTFVTSGCYIRVNCHSQVFSLSV